MAKPMSMLVLTCMHLVVLCGSLRTNRLIYQPYGPRMCAKLRQDLEEEYLFVIEDLSCRLTNGSASDSRKHSSNEDMIVCHDNEMRANHNKTMDLLTGGRICRSYLKEYTSTGESHKHICDIALHRACKVGNLCLVDYILSNGLADIDCEGKKSRTPVMTAAMNEQVTVFDFLFHKNCNLSAVDDYNDTVLHYACIGGNTEIVRKLITKVKYHLERRGRYGWTPVMNAAYFGHRQVVELLVGEGCNLTFVDVAGDSILHLACKKGHVDLVEHILPMNVIPVDSKGRYGWTPVMVAAHAGYLDAVRFLVRQGCNLEAVDDTLYTILHVASFGGHVDMVNYILSMAGDKKEKRSSLGRTPVMLAAKYGRVKVLEFLRKKGCNLKAVDINKDNILHLACVSDRLNMVEHILSMHVIDIESRSKYGRTPVMGAAIYGHVKIVKYLIDKGCNLTSVDDNKDNALHLASFAGKVNVVKYILSLQLIDVESKGKYGRTAALKAATSGHVEVVKLFVRKGCELTALDDKKNTMLHLACIGGHVDMVRYLITLGVFDGQEKNRYSLTPYYAALFQGKTKVVSLLKSM